ncbi:hypothetical protein [Bacillus sp. B1-b2]|uniref:hypothetical protein n=1 Tax=Bacillus sp. B1-b2 TaxID=2653201 RepID=UPI001262A5BC|nr:hypothetical protein [Bacillus sp. B1-b2]KAB7663028.1 hypothetical protein F9279_24345 [Bacillus sp. B1-b2]
MAEMRLRFDDSDLKDKLMLLAKDMGLSLNSLVNKILVARFSPEDNKYLTLMIDIAEFKRSNPE